MTSHKNNSSIAVYPRHYRVTPGWKILSCTCSLLFLVLGIWLGWQCISNGAQTSEFVLMGLGSLCVLAASVYLYLLQDRYHLELQEDRIAVQYIYRKKVLLRSEIDGWRLQTRTTPSTLVLEMAGQEKAIKLGMMFGMDQQLRTWLSELPALDDCEHATSIKEILADEQIGASRTARQQVLQRAKLWAKVLNGFSIVIFIAGWFYPRPYEGIMIVLALLPWVGMILIWRSRGLIRSDEVKNDAHPSVAYALIFPGLILTLRAVTDWNLLYSPWAVIGSLIFGGVLTGSIVVADKWLRQKPGMIALISLFCLSYGYGVMTMMNILPDHRPARDFQATVQDKHISSGKTVSYILELGPWGPKREVNELDVSRRTYQEIQKGQSVTIRLREGVLGVHWYYLQE